MLAALSRTPGAGPVFARVAVTDTIPYDTRRERDALPSAARIVTAARALLSA